MSKQIKKSIGWTEVTINPIKGRCMGNCWYCYYSGKRGIMNRFKQNPEIQLDLSVFNKLPKTPKKVFLCSTHDLFGDWIPGHWRYLIFDQIKKFPQHTFQILTKFPQNIKREMPENVWLGVSVTNTKDIWRAERLDNVPARIKFISFEPLLEFIPVNPFTVVFSGMDWVIIGRLTGHGKKRDPLPYQIRNIVSHAKIYGIPVFLKDNLQKIVNAPLIQEFPE